MGELLVDALGPADLPGALGLSSGADWNQVGADWIRILESSPDGVFAGRLGGRLVGTSTLVEYPPGVAWIGMVLVDEACRGRGFGTELLRCAVERAERRVGDAFGLDATGLGRPLYLKMGFVDVAPIDRWSGCLREGPVDAGVVRLEGDLLEEAAGRDRELCGADRADLFRRLAREEGAATWAVLDGGRPVAWAFLRRGRLAHHLGPWAASTSGHARALLAAAACELRGSPVRVDAFREEGTAELLSEAGLLVSRRLVRMTWKRPQRLLMGPGIRAAAAFEWG